MKNISGLLLITTIILTSCNKKTSILPLNDSFDSTTAVLLYEGIFKKGPYGTVTGTARVYESNGKWELRLVDFVSTNGPDLKIYLSKEVQPIHFIKLGDLRSTSGNQSYQILNKPDFSQYRYALVHCEQYNHLFGSAELMMK